MLHDGSHQNIWNHKEKLSLLSYWWTTSRWRILWKKNGPSVKKNEDSKKSFGLYQLFTLLDDTNRTWSDRPTMLDMRTTAEIRIMPFGIIVNICGDSKLFLIMFILFGCSVQNLTKRAALLSVRIEALDTSFMIFHAMSSSWDIQEQVWTRTWQIAIIASWSVFEGICDFSYFSHRESRAWTIWSCKCSDRTWPRISAEPTPVKTPSNRRDA